MITTAEEYQKYLWQLQDQNRPVSAILLPSDENVYEIDLNKRTISAPDFLSIKEDHAAETIYFLVDRFYDNMDLSTAACIVQYKNANGEERFFPVPFYDITTFSNAVSDSFIRTMVEEKNYKKNTYFVQDNNYNYILTSEEFDPTQEYYIKNTPNLSNKYVKVNLTTQTYTPGSFYYIETNPKSMNYGQYCQALEEFNPSQNYFAKIDRRYMQIAMTSSNYQKNYYYTINSNGNLEIDNNGYDQNKEYFIFIDSQKILFPWIISSDVTAAEGKVEFSIRFYQIAPVKTQTGVDEHNLPIYTTTGYKYIYNLNTQPATSMVLNGMSDIITQEAEKFDQSILAYLQSEIARLSGDYNLYWLEA